MNREAARGHAVVVQPDEGLSYWQPVPANGHADPKLVPAHTRYEGLSMGYQTIAAGGRVREHSHGAQIELQICFRGRGRVLVDGVSHSLQPGTACFLGPDVKHEIVKKRIDKALVKGRDQRVTQPGTIAIVYSQPGEAAEYRSYIEYLQHLGYLGGEVEDLELEELQGVHGLRALRVAIALRVDAGDPPRAVDVVQSAGLAR